MAWWDRLGKLPTKTLNRAAGVAMLAGLFALGIGIGYGCTVADDRGLCRDIRCRSGSCRRGLPGRETAS